MFEWMIYGCLNQYILKIYPTTSSFHANIIITQHLYWPTQMNLLSIFLGQWLNLRHIRADLFTAIKKFIRKNSFPVVQKFFQLKGEKWSKAQLKTMSQYY